ncbi:MFS transporter [Raineyella sp. W15-4]|uniref:MFS transporter n=1 Tax=Raineyella sp. W15-4 TaxID=3081651 RepID=UPI002954B211|nr:MFS transporter [Raineyella sp. W15-4]WOQ16106.1 MFS transporter [Raineyella sp. W15-4]
MSTTDTDVAPALSRRTVTQYAIGSIGTGGFNTLPGLVLLYYLTDVVGIAALAAGVVVAVAKVWDVVIDPVIGSISDRSTALHGSRRPLMRLGAVTIPIFFVLTFAVDRSLPGWLAGAWVTAAFVLAATSFSLFQIPYLALAAEITDRYTERTRLLTWRIVMLTVAILLFGGVAPAIRQQFDDVAVGYLVMAVASALLMGASMWIAGQAATARPTTPGGDRPVRSSIGPVEAYRQGWRAFSSSRPFRALFLSFVLKAIASGLLLAVGQYVATWVLHRESALTWIFLALIGPALLVTPVWGRLADRYGKEPLVYLAGGLFAAATASMIVLVWLPGPWLYVPVAVAGVAYAGLQSLPLSILPDVVAYETRRQHRDLAGVFTGVWTGGETAGLAFGAVLLSVLLQVGGYQASAGVAVTQPASAVVAIVLGLSIIPALLVLISLVVFRGYRLRRRDIEAEPWLGDG